MVDVTAIVEGETEQGFVNEVLASHLGARGVSIWPIFPGRRRRSGGVRPWDSVRGDILRALRERSGRICTTMFDFYGLPEDWPGRRKAGTAHVSPDERGSIVEKALLADLIDQAGEDFRKDLYMPYVQVHEFEALLFADVTKLAEGLAGPHGPSRNQLLEHLDSVLGEAGGQPEAINDGYRTCPSRRIASAVSQCKVRK